MRDTEKKTYLLWVPFRRLCGFLLCFVGLGGEENHG